MTRAALVATLLALGGCVHPVGPFVRSVQVDGYDLVTERCMINRTGESLSLGACTTERQRLPVTGRRGGSPDAGAGPVEVDPVDGDLAAVLGQAQIEEGIAPRRDAAIACGASGGLGGTVQVRVVVSGAGAVTEVEADVADAAVATCIHTEIGAARFPITRRGGTFTLTLAMP